MIRQLFLGTALLLSSAGGLVIEIVAGRLIAPYVGMSLYTWTAIIAVVLAGLSAGHWIGGRLAGAQVTYAAANMRLAVALGLASISSLLALALLRVLSGPLLSSGLSPVPVVILLTTALFLLPSLFVGIVAPILTKLALEDKGDDPGPVIGRMYAIGTLGSIAGTLRAGSLFISWIGSIWTVIAVAVVYGALALACLVMGRPSKGIAVGVGLLVLIGGTALFGQNVGAFITPCTVESDYFCIRVDDMTAETGRPSALMALDHLVHSINDRLEPGILYSPYIRFVDEYTDRRLIGARPDRPFQAFFIGGGGYSLPRAWASSRPSSRLVVAEIDPAVTQAAAEGMWLNTADKALDIRHEDARQLLQSLPKEAQFDVVFGDAFRDISIPAHLVTQEFHAEIAARLRPRGFYVVNVVDHGGEPAFLASLVETMKQDFKSVEIWAEAEELAAAQQGAGQRVTYILVASQQEAHMGRLGYRHGIARQWRRWPLSALAQAVSETPVILTDDYAPVDRLMTRLLLAPE
ncbi:MAG: fused MFS/spermidine synthase [Rhodospirillaceae bacterium]